MCKHVVSSCFCFSIGGFACGSVGLHTPARYRGAYVNIVCRAKKVSHECEIGWEAVDVSYNETRWVALCCVVIEDAFHDGVRFGGCMAVRVAAGETIYTINHHAAVFGQDH